MSLFPSEVEAQQIQTESELKTPREYAINFETGQLTGQIVEGIEALKVWGWLALKTPRYRHSINTWDYGNEIEENIIGRSYSIEYLQAECERLISECLLVNQYFTAIQDVTVTRERDKIIIEFVALTVYGSFEMNIEV